MKNSVRASVLSLYQSELHSANSENIFTYSDSKVLGTTNKTNQTFQKVISRDKNTSRNSIVSKRTQSVGGGVPNKFDMGQGLLGTGGNSKLTYPQSGGATVHRCTGNTNQNSLNTLNTFLNSLNSNRSKLTIGKEEQGDKQVD